MNEPSVMRMQQEAEQRVQRMAERSRRLVREHPINVYRGVTLTPSAAESTTPAVEEVPACTSPCAKEETPNKGLLSFLAGDEERVLLLLLIFMLSRNGAPAELLLALMYIAL